VERAARCSTRFLEQRERRPGSRARLSCGGKLPLELGKHQQCAPI
jgi:hypothetical protein